MSRMTTERTMAMMEKTTGKDDYDGKDNNSKDNSNDGKDDRQG
jgi:hypothetical protein